METSPSNDDSPYVLVWEGLVGTGTVRRTVHLRKPLRGCAVWVNDEKRWAVLTGKIQRTYYEEEPETRWEAIPTAHPQWLLMSDYTMYVGVDPNKGLDDDVARGVALAPVEPWQIQKMSEGLYAVVGPSRATWRDAASDLDKIRGVVRDVQPEPRAEALSFPDVCHVTTSTTNSCSRGRIGCDQTHRDPLADALREILRTSTDGTSMLIAANALGVPIDGTEG